MRVCEDIARFILNDKKLTKGLKDIRHHITSILRASNFKQDDLIKSRSVSNDIGRADSFDKISKKDTSGILYANLQRAKESIRVLEEFSKIIDNKSSLKFKKIRYKIYELEKKTFNKIKFLSHNR